jgi:hypothetical protein
MINFVGVFDIVAQFGLPGEHHHCYHAMAMDEERKLFPLTRLTGSGKNEKAV